MRISPIAPLSIIIATSVILASIHAGHVVGVLSQSHDDVKKISHEDVASKAVRDLHHHSDKSGAQFIKDVGDQQFVDHRSLRLGRDKKESLRERLAAKWQRALEELSLIIRHT